MRVLFTNTGSWGTGSFTVVEGVMEELWKQDHVTRAVFPDSNHVSDKPDSYHDHPDRYRILSFPRNHDGEHFGTFPLIIPDPHPRNTPDAWTYRDLTQDQLDTLIDLYRTFLTQQVNDFRPDIVESQHIWLMSYVLNRMDQDYVTVAHHSDQMAFRYDERMRPYAREAARGARCVFAISESVKQEVEELYDVPAEKIHVLSNGYDQDTFRPQPIEKGALLDEFDLSRYRETTLITFVGKVSRTKGIDVLLKANKVLQQNRDVAILSFGSGDPRSIVSELRPESYDLTNFVHLGHQPPDIIARFHNIADLSVLPSRTEGFGIAALEAMGCGLPVVATRTGGLPEFVVGRLCEIEDPEDLAKKIGEILSLSPESYDELRNESLAEARKHSWQDLTNRRLETYRTLLGT